MRRRLGLRCTGKIRGSVKLRRFVGRRTGFGFNGKSYAAKNALAVNSVIRIGSDGGGRFPCWWIDYIFGLINANVIDVTTLAALDAFIEKLVVIKLETAVDEDGTKVRIDADAVDGRAGFCWKKHGDQGINCTTKLKRCAILYLYSTIRVSCWNFLPTG